MNEQPNITVKYVAVGAAVALFLGVTVWLIRNEGRRTRDSIRDAAREAGSEIRQGIVEGAERFVDKGAEVPGKIVRELAGEGASAAKQVVGEAGRVSREILGDVKGVFDLGHQVSKAVDEVGQEVFALSWEEEQEVGRQVHSMVARELKLLRPPAVIERLQRLARPIASQRTRTELSFTLDVIQKDEVNAFAHAGGYLYVTAGLVKSTSSDAELQFFLAHEIAHQDLRHVVKRMTYAARASQLGGPVASQMAQLAYLAVAMGYTKEQEFEADAWAFRALRNAGRSRDEALSGMRYFREYVSRQELESSRTQARNAAEQTLQQIENHFRSHPPTAERLKRLEAIQG